jgi:hypothetical protein
MKFSHCCPKCLNKEIAAIGGGAFKGNSYNTIGFGFNIVYLTRYVCTNCGYCENFVDDPEDLAKIKRHFIKDDLQDDYV